VINGFWGGQDVLFPFLGKALPTTLDNKAGTVSPEISQSS
jgi:hypothetical protein